MRANFSDQDLTDYALDELDPHDRIYIESMLAASEECREDVCRMIDLAQLLETGFEREIGRTRVVSLKPEQRAVLTRPHFQARYALRDIASAIGLAACAAFAITHFSAFDSQRAATTIDRVANVSAGMKQKVSATVTHVVKSPETAEVKSKFESLRALVADPSNWLPITEGMPDPQQICTPPTLMMESAQLTR